MIYFWHIHGGGHHLSFSLQTFLIKDEVSLSQSSVALKGFVDAIQHVLIAAVPQLKEEVIPNEPVVLDDSESDGEEEETRLDASPRPHPPSEKPHSGVKFEVVPGNARKLDQECKVVYH